MTIQVYLAAPFFTQDQIDTVSYLERVIRADVDYSLYSPRDDGVLKDMGPAERKASLRRTFEKNCREILRSDLMIAVIDSKDTGTVWEMGFARAFRHVKIVTYTSSMLQKINVMLRQAVDGHVTGPDNFKRFVRHYAFGDDALLDYRHEETEEVT